MMQNSIYKMKGIIQNTRGEMISQVQVSLNIYDITEMTNEKGVFEITIYNPPSELHSLKLSFNHPNYLFNERIVPLDIQDTFYNIILLELYSSIISSENNTKILIPHCSSSECNAAAELEGNSYFYENGEKYTGKVLTRFGYLNPQDINQIKALPGNFTGITLENEDVSIETFGVIYVELKAENGKNLENGQISLTIPVDLFIHEGASLWIYNQSMTRWMEVNRNISFSSWIAIINVTRGGLYAVNKAFKDIVQRGILVNEMGPIPHAYISVAGVNYNSIYYDISGSDGRFVIHTKNQSVFAIIWQNGAITITSGPLTFIADVEQLKVEKFYPEATLAEEKLKRHRIEKERLEKEKIHKREMENQEILKIFQGNMDYIREKFYFFKILFFIYSFMFQIT